MGYQYTILYRIPHLLVQALIEILVVVQPTTEVDQ